VGRTLPPPRKRKVKGMRLLGKYGLVNRDLLVRPQRFRRAPFRSRSRCRWRMGRCWRDHCAWPIHRGCRTTVSRRWSEQKRERKEGRERGVHPVAPIPIWRIFLRLHTLEDECKLGKGSGTKLWHSFRLIPLVMKFETFVIIFKLFIFLLLFLSSPLST
jgi:hypothetical protein